MIPGPTPVVRSIQDQMARETCAFGDSEFVKDYKEVIDGVRNLFQCDGQAFVLAGSGTMVMEMAIANSAKRGDNILVVSHGFFGDRFLDAIKRKGINVDVMQSEWGKVFSAEEIDKKLSEKDYAAVTVTHVDTATGAKADIESIGQMMKKHPNTIYIVDGVAASAGIDERMTDMNIDIILTGSQKAFGVAPGIAILCANQKSLARRKELGETIPEFYVDYEKWLPIMNDPSKYFGTPPINLVWAMKESLRIINEEGIQNRYARHIKNAKAMRSALTALGFKILAEEGHQAETLSNVLYMDGVDDVTFRNLVQEEGIIVAGGLAAYAGKMFRIGHMGNVDTHDLVSSVAAIERTLYRMGIMKKEELGKGVAALLQGLVD